jgi:3-deoxy-manno-octulosonate cytidylyltransferase (CMP-KDO synthetase)
LWGGAVKKQSVVAVIPARWASHRFPGKMLAELAGRPLIEWTVRNAQAMGLFDEIYVAYDHPQVGAVVRDLGVNAVETRPECATGTDRIVEAMESCPQIAAADLVANIQGDEPCLERETVAACVRELMAYPDAGMATPISLITEREASDPSVVKCVRDLKGQALYFSRLAIPFQQKSAAEFYKHIGVYVFRRDFLRVFGRLAPSPLQRAEDLEQLKVLEHGYSIRTAVVEDACIGVNVPEDIEKVEKDLCSPNTSSSQVVSFPV